MIKTCFPQLLTAKVLITTIFEIGFFETDFQSLCKYSVIHGHIFCIFLIMLPTCYLYAFETSSFHKEQTVLAQLMQFCLFCNYREKKQNVSYHFLGRLCHGLGMLFSNLDLLVKPLPPPRGGMERRTGCTKGKTLSLLSSALNLNDVKHYAFSFSIKEP